MAPAGVADFSGARAQGLAQGLAQDLTQDLEVRAAPSG